MMKKPLPYSKTRRNQSFSNLSCSQRIQSVSNGCQISFSEWKTSRRSICSAPPGFENPKYPNYVYFLNNALYCLKQAPRAWYDRLSNFLLENGFERGTTNINLFYKKKKGEILLVQIYVDDIIFGSTKDEYCKNLKNL